MSFEIWILYVATVLALMSTPGSSQLLILSNSATYGFNKSYITAFGDLTANSLQMLTAALGLGTLIIASDYALTIIKWCGVAYLTWHAYKTFVNARPVNLEKNQNDNSISNRTLFLQGFITSASNPKAVLFFAALFPQFINYDATFWNQFLILSVTYLFIDGIFLALYAYGAQRLVSFLKPQATVWINRCGGILMFVAAIILGGKSLNDVEYR